MLCPVANRESPQSIEERGTPPAQPGSPGPVYCPPYRSSGPSIECFPRRVSELPESLKFIETSGSPVRETLKSEIKFRPVEGAEQ